MTSLISRFKIPRFSLPKFSLPHLNTVDSERRNDFKPSEFFNIILNKTVARDGSSDGPQPPYLPPYAPVGGTPALKDDLPACVVFLVLFVAAAGAHVFIFQLNKRRQHKFIFSMLLFGFCMARVTAISMRLAWALHPDDPRLAIAANVFVLLGGVIIITVNLFFTQRILRALKPQLGWHPRLNNIFWGILVSIAVFLIIVIVTTVLYFFTLSHKTRSIERALMLTGSGWLTTLSALPAAVIGYLWWTIDATRDADRVEDFGEGSLLRKLNLLLVASLLTTLGTGFRLGTNIDARPIGHPTWYHGRAAFYVFNFTIETVLVLGYAIYRVDKVFWVPNGAKGPGDYKPKRQNEGNQGNQEHEGNPRGPGGGAGPHVPVGSGQNDIELAERARKEAEERIAVASSGTSASTKVNVQSPTRRQAPLRGSSTTAPQSSTSESEGQASSTASRRALFARSSTTVPQSSTSESGGQASSSAQTSSFAASRIRPPGPSSSSSRAIGKHVVAPGATTGIVNRSDNTTQPADEEECRERFQHGLQDRLQQAVEDGYKPQGSAEGVVERGDEAGGSGSADRPSPWDIFSNRHSTDDEDGTQQRAASIPQIIVSPPTP